jgi:hypothetical protein
MIGLALWTRRSGVTPWQSTIVVATGALLAALMIAHQLVHVSEVLVFWGVLDWFPPRCRSGRRSTGDLRMWGSSADRVGGDCKGAFPGQTSKRVPIAVIVNSGATPFQCPGSTPFWETCRYGVAAVSK